jgi:hypothetical protein
VLVASAHAVAVCAVASEVGWCEVVGVCGVAAVGECGDVVGGGCESVSGVGVAEGVVDGLTTEVAGCEVVFTFGEALGSCGAPSGAGAAWPVCHCDHRVGLVQRIITGVLSPLTCGDILKPSGTKIRR